jgi:hypothetical protein
VSEGAERGGQRDVGCGRSRHVWRSRCGRETLIAYVTRRVPRVSNARAAQKNFTVSRDSQSTRDRRVSDKRALAVRLAARADNDRKQATDRDH